MARVIDLTAADGPDLLDRTTIEGRFRRGNLCAAPVGTYLEAGEVGRLLARNKSAGVRIRDGQAAEAIEPDSDYRAVSLLTDRRLLFVVGRADGDETVSLSLAEVVEAGTEPGLITDRLVVEATDGRTYTFPCLGDLDEFATAVGDDAAAWAHAERLREEADRDIGRARERLGMGEFDDAREALDGAGDRRSAALETLETVHPAAVDAFAERVREQAPEARALRRRVEAAAAASAHARAQSAWAAGDFEDAAAAIDRAIEGYGTSLALAGDEPADEQLEQRLAGAAGERAILAVAPVFEADAARWRAAASDDADVRAAAWESALEGFREAIGLRWPGDGAFRTDHEALRKAAADAADAAIGARREAGRQWLAAADRLAGAQGLDAAGRVYERATDHVRDALGLARAVYPEREGEIEGLLADVDRRRSGEIDVAAEPTEAPLPVDSVAEAMHVLSDEGSLPAAGWSDAEPGEDDVEDPDWLDTETVIEPGTVDDGPVPASGDAAGTLDGHDREAVLAGLGQLEAGALRELVAAVWSERGWATTVFTASDESDYDVLGARENGDERLLVWVAGAGSEEQLDASFLEGCRRTLDRSLAADRAAVVTAGPADAEMRVRAAELDVEIVDGEAFCDLLASTGLLDRVSDESA